MMKLKTFLPIMMVFILSTGFATKEKNDFVVVDWPSKYTHIQEPTEQIIAIPAKSKFILALSNTVWGGVNSGKLYFTQDSSVISVEGGLNTTVDNQTHLIDLYVHQPKSKITYRYGEFHILNKSDKEIKVILVAKKISDPNDTLTLVNSGLEKLTYAITYPTVRISQLIYAGFSAAWGFTKSKAILAY
ncbi:MAG: hypothetical protein HRT87_11555 [Legionellales bacterium]|nr:hypothetical protein [Legionellales bacterium]